jgi:hypothetical protein
LQSLYRKEALSIPEHREQCATYYHRPPAIEEGTFEDFANAMRGEGN